MASKKMSVDLLPVVDPADEKGMMWGIPQGRYIVIPADYDASVGAYNEREQIIATSDDPEKVRAFVKACRACGVFDISDYLIFDTETDDYIDE